MGVIRIASRSDVWKGRKTIYEAMGTSRISVQHRLADLYHQGYVSDCIAFGRGDDIWGAGSFSNFKLKLLTRPLKIPLVILLGSWAGNV